MLDHGRSAADPASRDFDSCGNCGFRLLGMDLLELLSPQAAAGAGADRELPVHHPACTCSMSAGYAGRNCNTAAIFLMDGGQQSNRIYVKKQEGIT